MSNPASECEFRPTTVEDFVCGVPVVCEFPTGVAARLLVWHQERRLDAVIESVLNREAGIGLEFMR